jgi:putative membrane protein
MTETNPLDPRVPLAQKRTTLAAFRTARALDRTTLAWIRTTLGMTSFGLGMIGFFRTLREHNETPQSIRLHEDAIRFGVALVLLGVAATILSSLSHWINLRRLHRGDLPTLSLWPLSIGLAILLAILAIAGLWIFLGN